MADGRQPQRGSVNAMLFLGTLTIGLTQLHERFVGEVEVPSPPHDSNISAAYPSNPHLLSSLSSLQNAQTSQNLIHTFEWEYINFAPEACERHEQADDEQPQGSAIDQFYSQAHTRPQHNQLSIFRFRVHEYKTEARGMLGRLHDDFLTPIIGLFSDTSGKKIPLSMLDDTLDKLDLHTLPVSCRMSTSRSPLLNHVNRTRAYPHAPSSHSQAASVPPTAFMPECVTSTTSVPAHDESTPKEAHDAHEPPEPHEPTTTHADDVDYLKLLTMMTAVNGVLLFVIVVLIALK